MLFPNAAASAAAPPPPPPAVSQKEKDAIEEQTLADAKRGANACVCERVCAPVRVRVRVSVHASVSGHACACARMSLCTGKLVRGRAFGKLPICTSAE